MITFFMPSGFQRSGVGVGSETSATTYSPLQRSEIQVETRGNIFFRSVGAVFAARNIAPLERGFFGWHSFYRDSAPPERFFLFHFSLAFS
jgi:hypothetical protein